MSIPTLQGLQTALSGLLAGQEALDVTGQNITNASTEGYSRQRVVLQTSEPLHIDALSAVTGQGAQLGTGVTVNTITRIHDTYLDAQYRDQSTGLGGASTDVEALQQAQGAFAEPSSAGLSSQLSKFWSAWSELADSPSSEAAKVAVVSAATQLTDTLHSLTGQLQSLEGQAAAHYAALTGPSGEVASDAAQLAQLNHQIKLSLQANQQPNELEDRRDLLVNKLSSLASVSVTKETDGTYTVAFGGAAQPLVEGSTVHWPQALTAAAGGQLGALFELSSPGGALAQYQTGLERIRHHARNLGEQTAPRARLQGRHRGDARSRRCARGSAGLRRTGFGRQQHRAGDRCAARRRRRPALRRARHAPRRGRAGRAGLAGQPAGRREHALLRAPVRLRRLAR